MVREISKDATPATHGGELATRPLTGGVSIRHKWSFLTMKTPIFPNYYRLEGSQDRLFTHIVCKMFDLLSTEFMGYIF